MIRINQTQSIYQSTQNSTSYTSGSVVLNGGIGIKGNAYIGGPKVVLGDGSNAAVLKFRSDVSNDVYQMEYRNPDTLNIRMVGTSDSSTVRYFDFGSYSTDTNDSTWTSRLRVPTSAVNGTTVVTGDMSISGALNVTSTVQSASTSSGAFICAGGVGIAKALFVGDVFTAASVNQIGSANAQSTSNSSMLVNGTLSFNNGTSNMLFYSPVGAAAPSYTTRSAGTKIILYPTMSGASVDHAIGIECFYPR